MKRVTLLSAALCTGVLGSAALACLNDRDTLAQEARGLPMLCKSLQAASNATRRCFMKCV
jgi:hypothetical protein